MSGGYYDYASGAGDLDDAMRKRRQLQEIADALIATDGWGGEDAGADLQSVLAYIAHVDRQVTARLKRLADVMHAVEWRQSGDYLDSQVRAALLRYRGVPLWVDEHPGWQVVPKAASRWPYGNVWVQVERGGYAPTSVVACLTADDEDELTVTEVEELLA